MDWIVPAYYVCLIVGVGYTIIAFALGEFSAVGGVGTAHDFNHDYGVGGHGGHGDTSGTTSGGQTLIFGPFSPLIIAFFLTSFGATGLILAQLLPKVFLPVTILAALAGGLLLAWLLFVFFNNVIGGLQGSSEVRLHTLIGTEAEVTVAIPAAGTGEVAYVAMGTRCLTPARSANDQPIPRFATVRVTRIIGNIFQVEAVTADTDTPLPAATTSDQA